MKQKSLFYLIVGIFGAALIVSAFVLDGRVPHTVDGALMGAGTALTGLGFARWRFFHWGKKYPAKWNQFEIESNDERNAVIRLRSQAAAGNILQWVVLAAAWVAIFLNAPLWVILAAVGIFLFKTILEIYLMAQYQKRM